MQKILGFWVTCGVEMMSLLITAWSSLLFTTVLMEIKDQEQTWMFCE